ADRAPLVADGHQLVIRRQRVALHPDLIRETQKLLFAPNFADTDYLLWLAPCWLIRTFLLSHGEQEAVIIGDDRVAFSAIPPKGDAVEQVLLVEPPEMNGLFWPWAFLLRGKDFPSTRETHGSHSIELLPPDHECHQFLAVVPDNHLLAGGNVPQTEAL